MDVERHDPAATKSEVVGPAVGQQVFDGRRSWRINVPAGLADSAHRGKLALLFHQDSPGNFNVARIGGELVVNQENSLLLCCPFARRLDTQAAGHIHRHRFGHVDMQAGLDGGRSVFGEEGGRRLQGNGLHAALNYLFVSRETGETPPLIHAHGIAALVGQVLEVIGHSVHLVATMPPKEWGDPASSIAAADQPQFDLSFGR